MKSNIRTHFGVYGVCLKEDSLLCIEKNAGPYRYRYDLPGGSQEVAEGLTETLFREVKEETGFEVLKFQNPRIYDTFVSEKGKEYTVHHIFSLYDVELSSEKSELPKIVVDGVNDSDGIKFVPLSKISEKNSSPLVLKVKSEIMQEKDYLKKSIYTNWERKDKKNVC